MEGSDGGPAPKKQRIAEEPLAKWLITSFATLTLDVKEMETEEADIGANEVEEGTTRQRKKVGFVVFN